VLTAPSVLIGKYCDNAILVIRATAISANGMVGPCSSAALDVMLAARARPCCLYVSPI
jgi:hypothetical protein